MSFSYEEDNGRVEIIMASGNFSKNHGLIVKMTQSINMKFLRTLSDKEKVSLKEVLILVSEKDHKMLAQSITENMIVLFTKQEAIDAILLHSATQLSLLLQEGIPREILFRYLHSKQSTTVT